MKLCLAEMRDLILQNQSASAIQQTCPSKHGFLNYEFYYSNIELLKMQYFLC